jgi:hypothetical protein
MEDGFAVSFLELKVSAVTPMSHPIVPIFFAVLKNTNRLGSCKNEEEGLANIKNDSLDIIVPQGRYTMPIYRSKVFIFSQLNRFKI